MFLLYYFNCSNTFLQLQKKCHFLSMQSFTLDFAIEEMYFRSLNNNIITINRRSVNNFISRFMMFCHYTRKT